METKQKYYEELHKKVQEQNIGLKKKYSGIATLRAIVFLIGVAMLLVGYKDDMIAAGIIGLIMMVVFCYLVWLHSKVEISMRTGESKQLVLERMLARFGEEWREFDENGEAYVTASDTVAQDIDLLGKNSLYQLLCVCHTKSGKQRLAETMRLSSFDENEQKRRSQAIMELASKMDSFGVSFETAGTNMASKKRKFDEAAFEQFCKDETSCKLSGWAKAPAIMIPILFFGSLVLWLTGVFGYGLPLATFLILLAFTWITRTKTDAVIVPLCRISDYLDEYLSMMQVLEKETFESELLNTMKATICDKDGALAAFRALRGICQAYNVSFNPLIHQICSGTLGWDYQLAQIASRWKQKYGKQIGKSFSVLGGFEELLSLSVIGVIRDTQPAVITKDEAKTCYLAVEDLYHPLISPDKVQANSASLNAGITIITGSNMSGKTTFLRTLAMNLALAYMGAPICGKLLEASYMKLFTSMRVTDDVAHGISTFYAEIIRIKAMADYREQEKPMLCLIDEIFKGTNSADRIVGATEAIRQLAGDCCMTIVSTHDFELCEISDKDGKTATNYHFEEYYEDSEEGSKLRFDYKIKPGRCTTTNARAILRMAGFVVQ
ncbi:MAG: DNA mismatch repair protein MutS [Lachnospiraceae bacterium]|nr:DNA mismatch repair protein MutS [Lachnospiraceae bacterium]